MSGLTKTNVQLGESSTATQNFTLTSAAADGTMKLARGNFGATTQDIITINSSGKVSFPQGIGAGNTNQSCIRLSAPNGYGSTNTKIRRFLTAVLTQGTDITYADSATLGALFTINVAGIYAMSYSDQFGAADWFGITLNAAALTTTITSASAAEILTIGNTGAANLGVPTGCTVYLPAGSLVRPHTGGTATGGAGVVTTVFSISRVS